MRTRDHFCYIVQCVDGTYYTGYTNDIDKRIRAHNSGRGAKYVKTRLPVVLVYVERYDSKVEAMRREYVIKRMTRRQKTILVRGQ